MNEVFIFTNLILVLFLSTVLTEVINYMVYTKRFTQKNRIQIGWEAVVNFLGNISHLRNNKRMNYNSFNEYIITIFIFFYGLYTFYELIYIGGNHEKIIKGILLVVGFILYIVYSKVIIKNLSELENNVLIKNTAIILLYYFIDIIFQSQSMNYQVNLFKLVFLTLSLKELTDIKLIHQKESVAFIDRVFLDIIKNSIIILILKYYLDDLVSNFFSDKYVIIFLLLIMFRVLNYIILKQSINKNQIVYFKEGISNSLKILIKLTLLRIVIWKF